MLTVYNKYDFTDFSEFDFSWNVTADGKIIADGTLALSTPPHGSETVKIQFDVPECSFGAYLNISMKNKAGYEVAFTQHELKGVKAPEAGKGSVSIAENGEYAEISGDI